jgi:HAMP domain-containing protein
MIRIQPRSVRVRLTLWYVGVMLLVLGVYAGVVYVVVRNISSQRLDDQLRANFDWAYDMLATRPDCSIAPYDETGEGDSPWFRVYNLEGKEVYSTPEARRNPVPSSDALAKTPDEQIVTVPNLNPSVRVLSGRARIGGCPVVVQVALSEGSIIQDQGQLISILLLGLPAAVALAGIGGYGLARRALAPVDRMAERARSISAEQLQARLPVDNPNDELGRLATVFNETFARLESSFERMRHFTADASH